MHNIASMDRVYNVQSVHASSTFPVYISSYHDRDDRLYTINGVRVSTRFNPYILVYHQFFIFAIDSGLCFNLFFVSSCLVKRKNVIDVDWPKPFQSGLCSYDFGWSFSQPWFQRHIWVILYTPCLHFIKMPLVDSISILVSYPSTSLRPRFKIGFNEMHTCPTFCAVNCPNVFKRIRWWWIRNSTETTTQNCYSFFFCLCCRCCFTSINSL